MHKLYPHLPRPHIVKARLVPTKTVETRPTWYQLAANGYDSANPAHVATAALRMGCKADEAKRRLRSAHRLINQPSARVEGSLKIACRESGVVLREVAVASPAGTKPIAADEHDPIYRAKERQLRAVPRHHNQRVAVDDDERKLMPVEQYVDPDPRNPLRRRIEERDEAITAGLL